MQLQPAEYEGKVADDRTNGAIRWAIQFWALAQRDEAEKGETPRVN